MFDQECIPFAPSLIESMRSIGYTFSAAIADLIDNSISAQSSIIDIFSEPSSEPYLVIVDNGCRMSKEELYKAMRYGSTNPNAPRSKEDLGRFGLGLKAASFSQCRKFIIVSKKNSEISACSWDLDYVIKAQNWKIICYSHEEIRELPKIELLDTISSGTYLILQNFDKIKESTSDINETFNKILDDMINHLSLVFHRFIDDGLRISVNDVKIEAMDPFLVNHPATQKKRKTHINIHGEEITLEPYVLPYISKLTQSDLKKVGGKEQLRRDQGFYVYRNRRLIIWGTWFRLERKSELNKLARVRVDIPNTLDSIWSIDIKKSAATLPDMIKEKMQNAVLTSVLSSECVYTYRGRKENKNSSIEYVWERIKTRDGYEYQINRNIPQLKLLCKALNDSELKLLNSIINTIESSFPAQSLYIDAAKGNLDQNSENENEAEKIWDDLQVQINYVKSQNLPVKDYYLMFMNVEPYCRHKIIIQRIQEELENVK